MATPITISLTQKAAILETHNAPYVVKTDYPVKQPSELAPGECLIKLKYSGVCHSDLDVILAMRIGRINQYCYLLEVMKALVVWWLLEHIVRVRSRLEIALASSGLVTCVDSVSYSLYSFNVFIVSDSDLMHLLACFTVTHGFPG
jgi:hypothetical protein